MSSDVEKIAEALRALAADVRETGLGVTQAQRRVRQLVDQAHAQGRCGLSVAQLVSQLQGAAEKGRAAAVSVTQIEKSGNEFADHLASAHGGGGSGHGVRDFMGDLAVGATAVLGLFGSPQTMLTDSPETTGAGEVGGSSMIDRSLDAADDLKEMDDGLKAKGENKIKPSDPAGKRSGRP
jgi:hypothetical protein